jgi:DNA-binding GntR family transcriptional regulator
LTCTRTLADVDKLDLDDARPPYQQVADALRHKLGGDDYGPGSKLPAHAAVADDFGVSIGTVKRAFAELQREGLIVTRQGQGSFVRRTVVRPVEDVDIVPALSTAEAEFLSPQGVAEVLAAIRDRLDEFDRRLTKLERERRAD